jgi:formyltetrahydrofolate-dependent phosphoribosylglycinamide formyltransferase
MKLHPSVSSPLSIAVLISGGGTTFRNLVEKRDAGELDVDFKLVISSSTQAKGLQYATELSVPVEVVEHKMFADTQRFSEAIFSHCREAGVDLVVMGGFLKHVVIPEDFRWRVMNIHPALIPAFCGQDFYGLRVHQAVLDHGAKISGCTVHLVDDQYDHGPIILQQAVEVLDNDTADTLASRVFERECAAYPEAIRRYAAGQLEVEGQRVFCSQGEG